MATKKTRVKTPSQRRREKPRAAAAAQETESEDGPRERVRQLLEERLSPLSQKGAPRSTVRIPVLDDGAAPDSRPSERQPAAIDYRRKIVRDYRLRQQAQLPLSRTLDTAAAPLPPLPPPANNWIPIGPSVLRQGQGGVQPATSGRTPTIAVAPGGSRVYIGAANGGVWRSDNAGQTWRSLMDAFDLNPTTPASDSLAVGAIAIDPANPDRVYVGSGEGAGAAYFGVGPIVTSNGTADAPAWTTEASAPGSPALAGRAFYALAVDPTSAERVVAATTAGVYRREPNGAGAFHWAQKTLGGAGTQNATSVVAAAAGGTTTFFAAVRNGPIFRSGDGNTWTQLGTGFPPSVGRVSLAVQRDNPNIVYALVENGAVYRLDTANGVWVRVTGEPAGFTSNQGWYNLAIAVAPDNVNRIYVGGSTVSSNGEWSGSLYRCEVSIAGANASMTSVYIGGSVHADIHCITFAPGDAGKLWVGCDGGVFYSTNPTGTGNIFVSRNTGLQTLTLTNMGQHPSEDAVLFTGTQDNGAERFTGEEAWLYSADGDCGYALVNWNDPYRVLATYVNGGIRRSTDGGQRRSYSSVNVPLTTGEAVLFYAPIAGTPSNPGSPTAVADANLVAFGSIRPWISATFGGGWQSIPNNTLAGDSLVGPIRSLVFASPNRLYAGTYVGWVFVNGAWVQFSEAAVYRFDRSGAAWTRTRIDTLGGANSLPLDGSVTDIVVDPSNPSRVYISLGGTATIDMCGSLTGRNGGSVAARPPAIPPACWMCKSTRSLSTRPIRRISTLGRISASGARPTAAPLGRRSSDGLPDAAVTDLLLHEPRRLLRAATHGRGAYERAFPIRQNRVLNYMCAARNWIRGERRR